MPDRQLGRHFEAVRQVAMADRLLLTKCDLAASAEA
jgi:G3E family GTPase